MDSTAVAIIDRIEQSLTGLADALQVPATQVWEILIRQAHIEGLEWGLWCAFWIIMTPVAFTLAWRIYFSIDKAKAAHLAEQEKLDAFSRSIFDPCIYVAASIFLSAFGVACSVGIVTAGSAALKCLLNPEYYALREILQAL